MRRLAAAIAVSATLGLSASAQDDNDDRGFLTGLIEDNLSDAGRTVRITGFAGALSSRATLDELTIADAEGVWLILRGAELDWTRSALLKGRLEIAALTADEIELPRLPVADPNAEIELPSPEAQGFRLPELPVSIDIDRLAIGRAVIGEAVFGEAAELTLEAAVDLDGGAGSTTLSVQRIDGSQGELTLDAAFDNATSRLRIDLALSEGPDGIAARLLSIPDRPSLALTIDGDGPLAGFGADIALDSGGERRLTGQVTINDLPNADGGPADRAFTAALQGDVRPLLAVDYRSFFGPQSTLSLYGVRRADGRTALSDLSVATDKLTLNGSARIAADGLPELLSLSGRIADATGAPVLLPIPGADTRIDNADLQVTFNAPQGELWTGEIALRGLDRPDLSADRLVLAGNGRIARDDVAGNAVTADLTFSGDGVDLPDPRLSAALGRGLSGAALFEWQEGQPLDIERLDLSGAGVEVTASGAIDGIGSALGVRGEASARIAELAPFSALADRPLAGRLALDIAGEGRVLDGSFDVQAEAAGGNIAVGEARLDPLLRGETRIVLAARRDETGLFMDRLQVTGDRMDGTLSGVLRSDGSEVSLDAKLTDVADVEPRLRGGANLSVQSTQTGAAWDVALEVLGPGALDLAFTGQVEDPLTRTAVSGRLAARVGLIGAYAALAGRPLSGTATVIADGSGVLQTQAFDVELNAETRNLSLGQPSVDPLLAGAATLQLRAKGTPDDITLDTLRLGTPRLTATLDGRVATNAADLNFDARLADIALYADGFSGPVSASGSARHGGGDWTVSLQADGPGGTTASVAGGVAQDFGRLDLSLRGAAPLDLANRYVTPNSVTGTATFDLALNGPPALSALSGQIGTDGARLVVPDPGIVLDGVGARVVLQGGRANLSAAASVQGGGRVTLDGPVALTPPFNATLSAALAEVQITDPALYETSANARLTVNGPLAGGARIAGTVRLGPTELQIPSTGAGASGAIPEITHVNEPAAVRASRQRAGLLATEGDASSGGGPAFPLDLLIEAPNRIFLRGRGLDTELGGSLRLRGTTADVVPSGQFNLLRGRLDILGKRLVLDEGSARLRGSFEPFIRLVASSTAGDTRVFVVVEGPAANPEIQFLSQPELPEDEVLARLLFGRGIETLSVLQAAQLASAVAALAGSGGEGILGRLRRNFGLDDLDVTSTEDGGTAVRAGRYLSENVYTDVVVGTGTSEINLNLDISPNVTVRGTVGSDGNTGIGLFFERDY